MKQTTKLINEARWKAILTTTLVCVLASLVSASPTISSTPTPPLHHASILNDQRCDHRRKSRDCSDRQIDLPRDNHECHGNGHDGNDCRLPQDVYQVFRIQKTAISKDHCEEDKEADEARKNDSTPRQSRFLWGKGNGFSGIRELGFHVYHPFSGGHCANLPSFRLFSMAAGVSV